MSIANNFTAFNPLNIDGTSYLDSVQSDINANITQVNTNLNNVSEQSQTLLYPSDSDTTGGVVFDFANNPNMAGGVITYPPAVYPWYAPIFDWSIGVQNRPTVAFVGASSILCSSSAATLNLFSFSTSTLLYDTFSGYSGNTYVPRTSTGPYNKHKTTSSVSIENLPGYSNFIADAVQSDITNNLDVYGTQFTVLNRILDADNYKYDYSGVQLYFPTTNTPRWMFLFVSANYNDWIPLALTKYEGPGQEVFSWNFTSTLNTRFWRIVVASASNTSFDLAGIQFFYNTPVGLGFPTEPMSLSGTCINFNNNPFPIIPLIEICDENTTLTTSTSLIYRIPITFRISNHKLPVFWVSEQWEPVEIDILYDYPNFGGTSIYAGAGCTPRLTYGPKIDSGNDFNKSFGRSCGLLKTPSMILEEGKIIKITVINLGSGMYGTPNPKGLKLTIYSS
jgi:hypothetical protein